MNRFRFIIPCGGSKNIYYANYDLGNERYVIMWLDNNGLPAGVTYSAEDVEWYLEQGAWIKLEGENK